MSSKQNAKGGLPLQAKKTSLEHMVMNITDKKLIIKVIDKLVLLNLKIAVQGSIIMNYLVAKCVDEGSFFTTHQSETSLQGIQLESLDCPL